MKPPSPWTGSSTAQATDSGSTVGLERELDRLDRVVARDAAVLVGRGDAVDLGRERPERLLVDELRGHRHREQRAPVERAVEDQHGGPAGRRARDLDGVLDRLGAAVDEHALRGARARGALGEQAADLDVALVGDDHRHLVEEAVDLRVHRRDDLLGPVPEVLAADAADEVEVLAAVQILDDRAVGAAHDELRIAGSAGDVALARIDQLFRDRLLLQRHALPLSVSDCP